MLNTQIDTNAGVHACINKESRARYYIGVLQVFFLRHSCMNAQLIEAVYVAVRRNRVHLVLD